MEQNRNYSPPIAYAAIQRECRRLASLLGVPIEHTDCWAYRDGAGWWRVEARSAAGVKFGRVPEPPTLAERERVRLRGRRRAA